MPQYAVGHGFQLVFFVRAPKKWHLFFPLGFVYSDFFTLYHGKAPSKTHHLGEYFLELIPKHDGESQIQVECVFLFFAIFTRGDGLGQ